MVTLPPIAPGMVINDRYEIKQSLGKGGMGEVFLAHDRTALQAVALKIVREESRASEDDKEALRKELLLARSVSHPNVCRVHDLVPSIYGPILVMEHIVGQTLHTHIRRKKAQGGYTPDEFRRLAQDIGAGVAAIHQQGLVHGDLKPGNVMVTASHDGGIGKAVVLDFGFAQERQRAQQRSAGRHVPDGGTPNYMSPERMRSGMATAEDDVYAVGLTLFEMWSCRVPEPNYKATAKRLREGIMFDIASSLSHDEVKQVFMCLHEDSASRPTAKQMRFFNPQTLTTNPIQLPRERLDPGPPPGRMAMMQFMPGQQSFLVTYSTHAPESVGTLVPIDRPTMRVGRKPDNDVVTPEQTVSGSHATMTWSNGSWLVEDGGSTNGTYVEHNYERQRSFNLLHGGEVQFGELRYKLVSFGKESAGHTRARNYLAKRCGLLGVLNRTPFLKALEDEMRFAWWAEIPLTVARYELRSPNRLVSDRPTILEMLALRRAAQRVIELTDMLLLALVATTAGKVGPLRFAVCMTGSSTQEAKHLVEQVVGQVRGLLPPGIELAASVSRFEHGMAAMTLVDG